MSLTIVRVMYKHIHQSVAASERDERQAAKGKPMAARLPSLVAVMVLFAAACSDNGSTSDGPASTEPAASDTVASDSDDGDSTSGSAELPLIIATTSIWADVVKNLACGDIAEIQTIMPPGSDPHTFEASLQDRSDMANADLVVANGLGLEINLDDTLDAVEGEGIPIFRLGDHIVDALEGGHDSHSDHEDHDDHGDHEDHGHEDEAHDDHDDHGHEDEADDEHGHDDHGHEDEGHDDHDHEDEADDDHEDHEDHGHVDEGHDDHDHEDEAHDDHDDHEDHGHVDEGHDDHDHEDEAHDDHDDHEDHGHDDHGHDHGEFDPHIWFDPVRVSDALPQLAAAISAIEGVSDADVETCLAAYQTALTEADYQVADIVKALDPEDRILVTNHDVFGYFADRYGFNVLGAVIPSFSTTAESSIAHLEELSELIAETGVLAIFTDNTHSTDTAEAVASHLPGVEVVGLATGSLSEADGWANTYINMLTSNAQRIVDALQPTG